MQVDTTPPLQRVRWIQPSGLASGALPAILLLALPWPGPARAATYHVAIGGNDAHAGTLAQPFATLQRAAEAVQAGDTVYVHAGTHEGAQFTTSGTPAQRIVVAAFPGDLAVIEPQSRADGINLEGASWVTVQGLHVTGASRAGIRAVLCRGVEIRDNVSDQNGRWGILSGFCDDLVIEGNQTSRSGIEHGVYVGNSGDRPVIRNNLVWANHANGIHLNGDVHTQDPDYPGAPDGVITGALVEGNIIVGNGAGGGSGINCDGVQDSLLRNNLIHDQQASGISLYRIDGGAPSLGNRVLNNTVLVASSGRWALNIQDGSTGTEVRNNIFHSDHAFRGAMSVCSACLQGMASDSNAVEDRFTLDGGDTSLTLDQWRAATGLDARSLTASPTALFTDAGADDYTLASGSPALDAGQALHAVPRDLRGTPRPQGPAHDIGAYEAADPASVFRDGFEA